MRVLRELSRRKLRTSLTVIGITIGIWALVVFSSMASQMNSLVGMGSDFYADKVVVTDGEAFGSSPMRISAVETIAALEDVAAVTPRVEFLWEADPPVGFSTPDLVVGISARPFDTWSGFTRRLSWIIPTLRNHWPDDSPWARRAARRRFAADRDGQREPLA